MKGNKKQKTVEQTAVEDEDESIYCECEPVDKIFTDINNTKTFHVSLRVNDLYVSIGSYVKILYEKDDFETTEQFEYYQILAIYHNLIEDVVYVEVRLFVHQDELQLRRKRKLGVDILPNELIETDVLADFPAGSIAEIIHIVGSQLSASANQQQNLSSSDSLSTFICRYMEVSATSSLQKVDCNKILERGMHLSEFGDIYSSHLDTYDRHSNTLTIDKYSVALRELHISNIPSVLPCRTNEKKMMLDLIRSSITTSTNTSSSIFYISGMPGTGKTATVMSTIITLKDEVKRGEVPNFDFIEINCLRLQSPADAYSSLWRGMSGNHVASNTAKNRLHQYFDEGLAYSGNMADRIYTVVLVDEIDFLLTRDHQVIYDLLNWPQMANSKLIVITVANTMDLPERLKVKVSSRLGTVLERLAFVPYDHEQVAEILTQRLKDLGLSVFDEKSIEFLARKSAVIAGDLRAALKICQRAIEILRDITNEKISKNENVDQIKMNNAIVKKASDDYKLTPLNAMLIKCCKLDKYIIVAVCIDNKHTGLNETTEEAIWARLVTMVGRSRSIEDSSIEQPPYHVFERALGRLVAMGFLHVSSKPSFKSSHFKATVVVLGIEASEIQATLRSDPIMHLYN